MKRVARVWSGAVVGFDSRLIEVESDAARGLPALQIVGLAGKAVDESKERVRSAIRHSLLDYPAARLTVNLSPAELPKDGSQLDLAIALAILVSSGQLSQAEVDRALFIGELTLDGRIRPVRGAVSLAELAATQQATAIYLPEGNVDQALLVPELTVYGVSDLKSLFLHLKSEVPLTPAKKISPKRAASGLSQADYPTLDTIYGQEQAKRAMILAAAGHHNVLLSGPPGAGKTMLAKALAGILPDLDDSEVVAVTKMHSLTDASSEGGIITRRPFRSPHHTASRIALIGGGTKPQPGEISLAHLGVLFLDEMPEYPRSVLEALRQPMEDRQVTVSRAAGNITYPADFLLAGTMNPCPCGYYGDDAKECNCSTQQILNYQKKLSGPLLDRIDIQVVTTKSNHQAILDYRSLSKTQQIEALNSIKNARRVQVSRYRRSGIYNGNVSTEILKKHLGLTAAATTLLNQAADKLGMSTRAYFKTLRLARTVADLEPVDTIDNHHIAEALQYRQTTSRY